LLATREKNGIFLSPESYNSLVSENTGNKTQIDEISKTMESKLTEMNQLQEMFSQQTGLLNDTNTKLDDALQNLDDRKTELKVLLSETLNLRDRLQEQQHLVRAHQTTEQRLDTIATQLKSTLELSVSDIQGLYAKIERKSSIESENLRVFEEFQSNLFAHFKSLGHAMAVYQDCYAEVKSKVDEEDKGMSERLEEVIFWFDKG
jgi:kinesin family member 11